MARHPNERVTRIQVGSLVGGPQQAANTDSAQARYDALTQQRTQFLQRARQVAEVTIPALMPPEGFGHGQKLYVPFQSVGARGTNSLASKLLLALLPPGQPFFRLKPDGFEVSQVEELTAEQFADFRGEIEKSLGKVERLVMDEIETMGVRTVLFETLKQLLNSGNYLLNLLPNGKGARGFRLDEYVAVRDNEGNLLEVIVQENLSARTVPERVRAALTVETAQAVKEGSSDEKTIPLYTRIVRRKRGSWTVYQEVGGVEVENTRKKYTDDTLPWIALRFIRIDGEAYGRGHGEEVLGDLQSLESLSQSLVEYGAVASKIHPMVEEGGSTDPDDLMLPTGEVIIGRAADVSFLGPEKLGDMRFVFELASSIQRRLEMAYLMNAAVARDAERVTAEEIRLLANDLEDTLGGTYSILSIELQLPLVKLVLGDMQRRGKAPRFDDDDVRPAIVTGLEALGRNRDLQRQEQLIGGMVNLFGQDAIEKWIKIGPMFVRRSTALGIDSEGLVRTEEEVAAIDQAARTQELLNTAAPNAVTQIGESGRAQQPEG